MCVCCVGEADPSVEGRAEEREKEMRGGWQQEDTPSLTTGFVELRLNDSLFHRHYSLFCAELNLTFYR